MNIYKVTSIGHIHYGRVLPLAQTWTWKGQATDLDWYVNKIESEGPTVTGVELVSTSTDCAGCGCSEREHFYGSGLCGLGFCRSHCGEFVVTL